MVGNRVCEPSGENPCPVCCSREEPMIPYTPPAFQEKAFNCPFCNAYATQHWHDVYLHVSGGFRVFANAKVANCAHCGGIMIWHDEVMIYPDASGVPLPNPDLRQDIQDDYREAASIVNKSPRGAAALLRLCVQKLCELL